MRKSFGLAALMLVATAAAPAAEPGMTVLKTPGGVRFGLWGEKPRKPASFIAATSWPSTFSQTRPLPEVATQTTGSCLSVFLGSFFMSENAVARTTLSGNITEF